MKKILLLIFLSSQLQGQDDLGYSFSKYSGINGIYINPTNFLNSKIFVDVNLIGVGLFLHNNLAYLPKQTFAPAFSMFNTQLSVNSSEVSKRGFFDLKITGPSIGASYGNFSFGIYARGRTVAELKASKDLASFLLRKQTKDNFTGVRFENENTHLKTTTWAEFGLHAGYMYKRNHHSFRNIAVNFKYLIGITQTNIQIKDLDLYVADTNKLENIGVKSKYTYTSAAWKAGKGFSIDLGWSYAKMINAVSNYYPNNKKAGWCTHIDYKYKIGFSLIDLGYINYKKNTVSKEIDYTTGAVNLDTTKLNSPENFDSEISKEGNGLNVNSENKYLSLMPLAVSAQYDYNFENYFYLNSSAIIGIRLLNQIKRPDILAFTLRYDRKYFGTAIPLSLYNWTYPQLGLAFRFGTNFIIGTDRIGFLFGKFRNTYGADVYFNLKFAIFTSCNKKIKKMKSIMDCIKRDRPIL